MQLSDIPDLVIPTTFAPATTHRAARPVEWSLGLEHALLDERALTALNTLVTGPVTSWDTVESAELALRSFILHKRADCLLPAVLLTHRSTHSLHAIRYASPVEPEAILSVVKATGMHNRPVFTEWLSVRDRRILDKSSFWTGKEDVLFGPEPGLRAAFNEYLQSDGIGPALAATPTAIGAPSYFGIGPLRVIEQEALKEYYPRPGSRFYDNLDQQWRDHLKMYEHAGFDVRIGPLVTIVLTRASRREEIPEIVLELRSQFAQAGEKLWQMLAELQLEKDPSRLLKKCPET